MRRSRELKPLSSEHHQALLVAFQLKQGLAGHPESAGAPKDLAGLGGLARRLGDQLLVPHTRVEEDLLAAIVGEDDLARLRAEHAELFRLLDLARTAAPAHLRTHLGEFADLLERHVRWEERELFPHAEARMDGPTLARIGAELERRLVLARTEAKPARPR